MSEVLLSPKFSFAISIAGIFLAVLGVWLALKFRSSKKLSVVKLTNKEIISKPVAEQDLVTIFHDGKEVKGLNKLEVEIKNTGNDVLRKRDFASKPSITFKGNVEVISLTAEAKKGYISPSFNRDTSGNLNWEFEILEPKEKIVLKVLYAGFHSSAGNIFFKIIGGNESQSQFSTNIETTLHKNNKPIVGIFSIILSVLITRILGYLLIRLVNFGVLNSDTVSYLEKFAPLSFFLFFGIGLLIESRFFDNQEKRELRKLVGNNELQKSYLSSRIDND